MIELTCEFCGRQFASVRRKRRFCSFRCYSTVRAAHSVTKICPGCEALFVVPSCYGDRFNYCSASCAASSHASSGANNPNWRGGRYEVCQVCGGSFWIKPSHSSKRKTCSRECAATLARDSERAKGEKNPAFGKRYICDQVFPAAKPVEIPCAVCGTSITRMPWMLHGQRVCCSRKCQGKLERVFPPRDGVLNPMFGKGHLRRGENNANWRGGRTYTVRLFRKSLGYSEWRSAVLNRDDHRCTGCAATEGLEIHHILPVRTHFNLALDVDNGVTLCRACHQLTPNYGGRRKTDIKMQLNASL